MKLKKFSKLIALVLVLSLVFAFTACGKGGSDDTIKLGILCSLTGNSQTNGGYAQQGAKMAVEEINAAGGINGKQIELVIEDDGGKADTAINAYNKLQSQKVVAIVGPMLSSLALAMDQNVQTGKIPLLIGATSAALTDNIDNPYFHRLRCSDTIMAEVAASYAVSNYGAKKIGIFYCSDDYGSGAMHTITKYRAANTPMVMRSETSSLPDLAGLLSWSEVSAGVFGAVTMFSVSYALTIFLSPI